jgi:glycosyltransferase involved in cell wall biosynthesis
MPGDRRDSSHENTSNDRITVVVCAYTDDRWDTLQQAINVTLKQMEPEDELIIVVDHNKPLLARCLASFDSCLVVPNRHRRGLSGARNTALHSTRGSIIVFLDDDAIPRDGWLNALRAPYADNNVYGVGGFTTPRWPGEQPRWFPPEFFWVIGCSHLGLPSDARPVRNLIGANMSFRKIAFEQAGIFAENLGRTSSQPLGCEETEFSIRLTQANANAILLYDPSAQVEHHVERKRKSAKYFAQRCWAEGLSKAEVTRRVGRSHALSTERDYTTHVLPRGIRRGLSESLRGDLWGAARSAAIITGLAVTSAGYCFGTLCGHSGVCGEERDFTGVSSGDDSVATCY